MSKGPTIESLTGMGLLGKQDNITIELVSLRDIKRKNYFDKFYARNGRTQGFVDVRWGQDSDAKDCSYRCNANIVLIELGAKIPALEDGSRLAKEVSPIYQLPLKTLGEWGLDNLTCSQSTYKGMDRVLISEPSRMPVPRFYEYLPKRSMTKGTKNARNLSQNLQVLMLGSAQTMLQLDSSSCDAILP